MGFKTKEAAKAYYAAYYKRNKQKKLEYSKKNAYKYAAYMNNYQKTHLERIKTQRKNRALTDITYRLSMRLRSRINRAVRKGYKSGSAVADLGCTVDEFKQYIESKFKEGMSWSNWGISGWHLDHIKPLVMFDLSEPDQFKLAAHYTNMQPLWANENLRKNKYE